jgi:ectoine hydroxylase-related dioxygenase (phytanoyl-CoA dioxygenase family)
VSTLSNQELCSLSMGVGGFLLFLGHLYHTTGRNAQTEVRREDRGAKFVVEESDEEDIALRPSDAYELQGAPRTFDSDDEMR